MQHDAVGPKQCSSQCSSALSESATGIYGLLPREGQGVLRTITGNPDFTSKRSRVAILIQVMSLQNLFGVHLQIGNKPAKYEGRCKTTDELSQYKPGDIDGPDACERIAEASCDGYRGIRK